MNKPKSKLEQCNCEQALYYKKMGRKLANAVMRYAIGNQEKYGDIYYLAEKIVPIANNLLKEK